MNFFHGHLHNEHSLTSLVRTVRIYDTIIVVWKSYCYLVEVNR